MTTRDAFLANILANPAEDAPRLIFADWLEEQGEAERAEFIRVQCELAQMPPKPQPALTTARLHQIPVATLAGDETRDLCFDFTFLRPDGDVLEHADIAVSPQPSLFDVSQPEIRGPRVYAKIRAHVSEMCLADGGNKHRLGCHVHSQRMGWLYNEGEIVVTGDCSCRCCLFTQREQELMAKHACDIYRWPCGSVHVSATWPGNILRRGFLVEITCTCSDWLQHGPTIIQQTPLEQVTLSDTLDYLRREPPGVEGWRWIWDIDWGSFLGLVCMAGQASSKVSPIRTEDAMRFYTILRYRTAHRGFATHEGAISEVSQGCLEWARELNERRQKEIAARAVVVGHPHVVNPRVTVRPS